METEGCCNLRSSGNLRSVEWFQSTLRKTSEERNVFYTAAEPLNHTLKDVKIRNLNEHWGMLRTDESELNPKQAKLIWIIHKTFGRSSQQPVTYLGVCDEVNSADYVQKKFRSLVWESVESKKLQFLCKMLSFVTSTQLQLWLLLPVKRLNTTINTGFVSLKCTDRTKTIYPFLFNKTNRRTNFSKFIFVKKLYMFMGSFSVHREEFSTVHSALVYVMQVWWQLESCHQTCMTYTSAECTVENSWWWAEKLPETFMVIVQLDAQILFNVFIYL